jgi:hypothetical protein
MIANASRICCSLMQSGGLVKKVFQRTKVYSPCSRKKRPRAAISSEVPLNGARGWRVLRLRMSSTMPNRSDRPHRAHRRMLRLQLRSQFFQHRAHFFRIVDQPIFFIHANRRQRRRASHGMTVVSQPAVEDLVLKMLRDVMAHADRSEREIAGRQSLGHANQIGYYLPVIDREPLTGSSEASHHFIGDHQDSVLVAELAHASEISIGWNENAVGSSHGLKNESGDRLRPFELDGFFDHRQRRFGRFPSALDAVIGIENMHDTRNARLSGPSARIAGEADRCRRSRRDKSGSAP